ncbi:Rap1a/Tai family immunity protein [Erythrobacter sp. HA6-11]
MLRLLGLFASALLAVLPYQANASFHDGNALYDDCSAKEGGPTYYQKNAFCTAYIVGVVDTINYYQGADEIHNFVCIPPNVRAGQLRDVVVKFLRENPAERHKGAEALVFIAVAFAFPCENEG